MNPIRLAGLRAALDHAEVVNDIVSRARADLQQHLTAAVSAFIYPGLVVDLRDFRKLPECFSNVKTSAGSDRGTHIFRFESVPAVEVNMTHPSLSTWRCAATPISEKTGKDMSGASHGANSRDTVTLYALLVREPFGDLEGAAYKEALTESLVMFADAGERALRARERAESGQAQ